MNRRGGNSRGRATRRAEPPAAGDIIADAKPDPGRPGCVCVRIRGRKPWRIALEDAAALRLAAGVELSDELIGRLDQAAANCGARFKLRNRLAARPLSRIEALALMRRAGAEPAFAAETVAEFEQRGWIDDSKLAESVAASESMRTVGRNRVVAKVARRGINSSQARRAAEAAIEARGTPQSELAEAAAKTQLRKLPPGLDGPTRRRRLLGFLARRGFDEYTSRQAIDAVLGRGRGGE